MRICIVSITVLFSVPMVAASYAVAATTVTNDVIFTNPARSIHWKTVCSGNLEIPVPNWPDGASSATLSVSGNDFAAKTFTISSPEDSFRLTLALPDTEETETMLTFTLTYATETGEILAGEPHSATLGFVRGVGNGATVKCVPGGEGAREWFRIRSRSRKAIIPITEDVEALSLDGVDTTLPQAPGWYRWGGLSRGSHSLNAVTNGVAFGGTYLRVGDYFVFIVK